MIKGRKLDADSGEQGAPDNGRALQRWTARRKRDVVLRLFRGESLDAVSRDVAIEIPKLEKWRDQALEAMDAGLRARTEAAGDRELETALQQIGELSMQNELLRRRCDLARPSLLRRSKP